LLGHALRRRTVPRAEPILMILSPWRVGIKRTRQAKPPGARTFEAQLEDGSWLNISERRTKDGGYVFTQVHNIQANVPPEKVLAIYEAAAEFR